MFERRNEKHGAGRLRTALAIAAVTAVVASMAIVSTVAAQPGQRFLEAPGELDERLGRAALAEGARVVRANHRPHALRILRVLGFDRPSGRDITPEEDARGARRSLSGFRRFGEASKTCARAQSPRVEIEDVSIVKHAAP